MDTNPGKTPVPLPFRVWQDMAPRDAARAVHSRLAALPPSLRSAAVAWVQSESALAAALAQGAGPLRGIPYALKDLFDVAGVPTQAGSTFLSAVRPTPGDSMIVLRSRALGAALAAKTHLVEFASGLTGENPHYGDCPHPGAPDRLSGGSSSGSAALVAAGVVPLAIGTDTGGSVRIPAAFCGLHGFRLAPRETWIRDAFPLSPTMDTIGWFTGTAEDMLTSIQAFVGSAVPASRPLRGAFLPGRALLPEMPPEVDEACARSVRHVTSPLGPEAQTDWLRACTGAVDAYLTIGMSEAHAIHRQWLAPYREHYDAQIWQRFSDAGRITPGQAARAREKYVEVQAAWDRLFGEYDFLALPCAPFPALRKNECTPTARRNILTLTAPASLGGLPCLTLPVPLRDGLTVGVQVVLPRADSPAVPWILRQCA